MSKAKQKRKREQDANRQKEYQKRLKESGKSQIKVTLDAEATAQLNYFVESMPDMSKSEIVAWAIDEMYKQQAPAVPPAFKSDPV